MPANQVAVGVQNNPDSATLITARGGKQGDQILSELHGRFYEQTYRGNVYCGGGVTLTSISAATFSIATTGATATPVLGLWNPLANSVNLVLLQAALSTILTALQETGGGPYVWATSLGNNAITTGAIPINRKTLQASGSNAKVFGNAAALTGMTGTLAAIAGSSLPAPFMNLSSLQTAAGFALPGCAGVENFGGSLIVPPGGVLALLTSGTPVAQSAAGALLWEEVLL